MKKEKKVNVEKVEKKEKKEKKPGFFKETGAEMKKVSWPSAKDVAKYTVATLVFCLIVVGFFQLLNLALSFVKGMFA